MRGLVVAVFVVVVTCGVFSGLSLALMLAWNALAPAFGGPELSIGQAFAVMVLAWLILGRGSVRVERR